MIHMTDRTRFNSWAMALALGLTSVMAAAQFHEHTVPVNISPEPGVAKPDDQPRIAGDGAGNWVAVWRRYENNTNNYRPIVVTRSSDAGVTWTAFAPIDPAAPALLQRSPEVVTDGNGTWIVTCAHSSGSLVDTSIVAYRSTDNGLTWSPPQTLGVGPFGIMVGQAGAPMATDGAGNWIVVWEEENDGARVSRSSDDGVSWSPPAAFNSDQLSITAFDPRIATDGSGTWIAVWSALPDPNPPAVWDTEVVASRSTDNGLTWTIPVIVNSDSAIDEANDTSPDIATDGNGNWLVAWEKWGEPNGTTTDYDIFRSQSIDAGASWMLSSLVEPSQAVDSILLEDRYPRLYTDAAGNWVVGWVRINRGDSPWSARPFFARSSNNGADWTAPDSLDSGFELQIDNNEFDPPHLATDGAGNWAAVWGADFVSVASPLPDIAHIRWTGILAPDRDGDNLSDADEMIAGTSSDTWDTDGDTLSDEEEVNTYGTSPLLADSDGDGVWDFIEISLGTDPNDPFDFPILPISTLWTILAFAGIGAITIVTIRRHSHRVR